MTRRASDPAAGKRPKRASPFTGNPYGTYEGPAGSAEEWRRAFGERMDHKEAEKIVGNGSPWSILGINPGASMAAIKSAYRQLMKKHHPDVGGDVETCRKIIAAYEILTGK